MREDFAKLKRHLIKIHVRSIVAFTLVCCLIVILSKMLE